MIVAYTGMPGGGKTYALVWRAKKAMKEGRMVFSNVYIQGTYQITFDDILHYRFPEGSVVIFDEGGRWFNSKKWKELPDEVFDLFTIHRHLQMDLFIGVQSFNRIDKSLREVIEVTYWSRNLPILPFHIYEGYYELEKVGSMRRDYDVKHIIWKNRKLRSLYNTHSMKHVFSVREEMPLNAWETKKYVSNKRFYEKWFQMYRIEYKNYKRLLGKKVREKRKEKRMAAIERAIEKGVENPKRFINKKNLFVRWSQLVRIKYKSRVRDKKRQERYLNQLSEWKDQEKQKEEA